MSAADEIRTNVEAAMRNMRAGALSVAEADLGRALGLLEGTEQGRHVTLWRWIDSDHWHVRWPGDGPHNLDGKFWEVVEFVEAPASVSSSVDAEPVPAVSSNGGTNA